MAVGLGLAGVLGGQARAVRLDQGPGLVALAQLDQVQRGDGGARAGPADHQPLQRKAAEGVAHPGQAGVVARRQRLLVQPRARRQAAQDQVQQDALIDLGLLQVGRPVLQPRGRTDVQHQHPVARPPAVRRG
jgi:hypothetical protein